MPDPAPPKPRDVAFDAFRGIAIILAVHAHSAICGFSFQHAATGAWNFYFSVFFRDLSMWMSPIFLFVSGYFLADARFSSPGDYTVFMRRRASRILIPYLVWSTFFILLTAYRAHTFSLHESCVKLLLGEADGPYFFIPLVMQFYLLMPFLVWWSTKPGFLKWGILCHAIAVAFFYWMRAGDPGFPVNYVKVPCVSWLTFFLMGMALRRSPGLFAEFRASYAAVLALVFLLLSFGESLFWIRRDNFAFAISDVRYTMLISSAFALVCFAQLRFKTWPKLLVALGDYSLGIYFIHGFILRRLDAALHSIDWLHAAQVVYQPLMTASAVIISYAIIFATRRVIGTKRARNILGF